MKKCLIPLLIGLTISLGGCGTAAREIAQRSMSEKEGVFHEISEGEAPREGFVNLRVSAQVKTHLEGWYLLEAKSSLHGKPEYPFLFNIDGQAVKWEVKGQQEKGTEYEGCMETHDCGTGMRYILFKEIALREGAHRIFFALPGDDYRTEFEITLNRGERYVLELRPVYRAQHYLKGIVRLDAFLNGTKVQQNTGWADSFLEWK